VAVRCYAERCTDLTSWWQSDPPGTSNATGLLLHLENDALGMASLGNERLMMPSCPSARCSICWDTQAPLSCWRFRLIGLWHKRWIKCTLYEVAYTYYSFIPYFEHLMDVQLSWHSAIQRTDIRSRLRVRPFGRRSFWTPQWHPWDLTGLIWHLPNQPS